METKAFAQETETDCWKEHVVYLETKIEALLALNKEQEGKIEALMARVLKLTQQVYGRKSEQQSLQEKDSEDDSPPIQSSDRRQYTNLPVREEIHAVSEANQHCPHCGVPYDPFPPGEETSVEIDWRVAVPSIASAPPCALYNAIYAHCQSAGLWQADETGWKVFEEVEGKASNRWWLWAFASSDAVVFVMDPSRSATVPKKFFGLTGNDPHPAKGLLGSDFYRVYQALGDGIQSFFCWAHMRRHFLDAARGYPHLQSWTDEWRDRIATLYRLHAARQKLSPGAHSYLEADDELHRFVKDEIEANWRRQVTDRLLPLAARDVLGTVQRHWEGLTRFLDNPELPLDNNAMERLLRTPVVGRKNPLTYLTDLLTAGANPGAQPLEGNALERFLPWLMSDTDKKAWDMEKSPGQAGWRS